jgi:hypothetical protein
VHQQQRALDARVGEVAEEVAELTSAAYFAKTPLVYFGAGGVQAARRLVTSSGATSRSIPATA